MSDNMNVYSIPFVTSVKIPFIFVGLRFLENESIQFGPFIVAGKSFLGRLLTRLLNIFVIFFIAFMLEIANDNTDRSQIIA